MQQNVIRGATSELWLGEAALKPEQIAVLISRAFYQTNCSALTLVPEFTLCLSCNSVTRGIVAACPLCKATKLDILALAANHYSRLSTWPRWKVEEFKLRNRELVT
jgi:ribonucleoside-triphosphate reductase (formate)